MQAYEQHMKKENACYGKLERKSSIGSWICKMMGFVELLALMTLVRSSAFPRQARALRSGHIMQIEITFALARVCRRLIVVTTARCHDNAIIHRLERGREV